MTDALRLVADNSSDADLIRRALVNARDRASKRARNWVVAKGVFGFGSTAAQNLCRRFGYDPDGTVMTFNKETRKT